VFTSAFVLLTTPVVTWALLAAVVFTAARALEVACTEALVAALAAAFVAACAAALFTEPFKAAFAEWVMPITDCAKEKLVARVAAKNSTECFVVFMVVVFVLMQLKNENNLIGLIKKDKKIYS
jgi:hypothetical protein